MVEEGRHSDRNRERKWHVVMSFIAVTVGLGFASITANPIVKMAAICIANWGLWSIPPVFYTFPTAFLSGAGAAAGIAAINSIGALGGYFGPKIFGQLRDWTGTTYYNQYEQMEWGIFPHQGNMMDVLWERSALKHVAKVKTPVMLMHGENDSDVPIAESEQFYVALKDVGVETVMVRYPREGHGLREPRHIVDSIDRSLQWYAKHFLPGVPSSTAAIGRPAE